MKRRELEMQYRLMVDFAVARNLREIFEEEVDYEWINGPLSRNPKIEIFINKAAIELSVSVLAGVVCLNEIRKDYGDRD